jgi:hypothetical protein
MNAWYEAEIRWAVMEEGKQGLREWKDAVYFFLSESRDAAFQRALEIGYRECDVHEEDGKTVASQARNRATVIRTRIQSGRAGAAGRFLIPKRGRRKMGNREGKLCF